MVLFENALNVFVRLFHVSVSDEMSHFAWSQVNIAISCLVHVFVVSDPPLVSPFATHKEALQLVKYLQKSLIKCGFFLYAIFFVQLLLKLDHEVNSSWLGRKGEAHSLFSEDLLFLNVRLKLSRVELPAKRTFIVIFAVLRHVEELIHAFEWSILNQQKGDDWDEHVVVEVGSGLF